MRAGEWDCIYGNTMRCHFASVCEGCRDLTAAGQSDRAIKAALWCIFAAVAPRRSCYVRLCVKSGRSVTSGLVLATAFARGSTLGPRLSGHRDKSASRRLCVANGVVTVLKERFLARVGAQFGAARECYQGSVGIGFGAL
jgi:hypothetical protein